MKVGWEIRWVRDSEPRTVTNFGETAGSAEEVTFGKPWLMLTSERRHTYVLHFLQTTFTFEMSSSF